MIGNHNINFIERAFIEMRRKRYGISFKYLFDICPIPESPKDAYFDSYIAQLEEAIYEHNKLLIKNEHNERCFFLKINWACPIPHELIKVKAKSDFDRFYVLEDIEEVTNDRTI
jgi:hypothetical protein